MKDWRETGQLCFGLQIAYRRASETSAQLVKYQEDTLFHYAVFCDNYGRRGADLTDNFMHAYCPLGSKLSGPINGGSFLFGSFPRSSPDPQRTMK